MMNQAERRGFVAAHRTCIFGFQRQHGPPSMSVVYYVMDGDDGSKMQHGLAERMPWKE